MNFQVLLDELAELRADFLIPPSYPIVHISAETCIVATEKIQIAEPEIRLLANAVFQNGEMDRLLQKLMADAAYSFEFFEVGRFVLLFTFPVSFDRRTTVMRLAQRTAEQLKMRGLAAQKIRQLESRIDELTHQLDRRRKEIRDRTSQIVRQWISGNANQVKVAPEVIGLLQEDTATEIISRLTGTLQLEQFLQPGQEFYEITPENLQPKLLPALKIQSPVREKAGLLLERYETAAQRALEKDLKPNGKNIASLCEPPVSPPAVTDSLQKHRKQIEQLLAEHPERWVNARRALKPLRDIDEKLKYNAA